jgi:hypothetical protein
MSGRNGQNRVACYDVICNEVIHESDNKTKLRPIIWLLIIVSPLIYICLLVGAFIAFNHFYVKWEESHDIEFDLKLWESGSKDKIYSSTALKIDAPRIKMCRDFIAKQPWKGKTKEEIEAWLGKPDNFPFYNGWDFNYWVGLQRGPMKIDSAWLCFRFDNSGKAVEAQLKQD